MPYTHLRHKNSSKNKIKSHSSRCWHRLIVVCNTVAFAHLPESVRRFLGSSQACHKNSPEIDFGLCLIPTTSFPMDSFARHTCVCTCPLWSLHGPSPCRISAEIFAFSYRYLSFSSSTTLLSPRPRFLSQKVSPHTLQITGPGFGSPTSLMSGLLVVFFLTLHMHPHIAGPILRTHVSETLRHLLIVYALEPLVGSLTYPTASIGSSAMHRPATPAHEFSRNQCYPNLFAFLFQRYTSILTLLTWFPSSRD
jgi:hypothetical protein